ncbi:hypothetical protein V6Z72_18280 [Cereibacter sphaeroides]|uniref:hypothetical protein n=1 Tax=Cereibacter sphaeroides TaxID=1063 RepID=UPI0039904DD6
MQVPDFIAHQHYGIGVLTPGQKLHLQLRLRSAHVSLASAIAAGKYLSDIEDEPTDRRRMLS